MKKYIFVALLFILSCKAPEYVIGMNEQDFLGHNSVAVVEQTEDHSIYKKTNYPFGGAPITKFFYFSNGKLIRVDIGKRSPDVIIERRNSNK